MNSLLYYYNNVQKMAAYRQAKRMQRGVISGFRQPIVNASSTKFTMPPINIGTSDFSFEYFGNSSNVLSQATAIYFIYNGDPLIVFSGINGGNGILAFAIAGKTTVLNWEAGSIDELFHIVLSREGKSISLYVNGQKLSGFETSEVIDFGDISFMFSNASNLGLIRMWNYALSADEIATLDNNGDPMGYVLPKAMRGEVFSYLSDFTEGTDGWKLDSGNELSVEDGALVLTGSASPLYMTNSMSNNDGRHHFYSVELVIDTNPEISRVTCFAFQDSSPARVNNGIDNGDGTTTYHIISPSELRTYKSIFQLGFDMKNVSPVKIRSIKLKTALCLAEYLPQNLMFGRDDKAIATSWLDSAKQLPLSDESMEPLFQSVGGYDMAANGAPEILYNE